MKSPIAIAAMLLSIVLMSVNTDPNARADVG